MFENINNEKDIQRIEIQVFIAGAGPSGLTTAALLAKSDIDVLAVSMHPGTANSPRAHITNLRAMEVFRDLGIEEKIYEIGSTIEMSNAIWCTSLAGKELGRISSWGKGDDRLSDYLKASPSTTCNAPQHVMEPILLDTAIESGARVLFNCEVLSVKQSQDKVFALIFNHENNEHLIIESEYIVGADGARSVTAKDSGFDFEGEMGKAHAVNCWFDADLTKYCEDRPAVIWPTLQPGNDDWIGGGTFVCVSPWKDWVLLFMYDPDNEENETSEKACSARINKLIGEDVDLNIKAVSKWTINSMYAKSLVKDRVIIMGDAAHRHPPAGGLGTNTCVQDAFNLAWKLALIVKGKAGSKLLESYSEERQPVAKQMVSRAITAMKGMQAVPQALGFRPGQSEKEAWAVVDKFESGSEEGKEVRKKFREALDLQNWQFNGLGGEAGHHYQKSSAVVSDGAKPVYHAENEQLNLYPTTTPGSSIPHAWLQFEGKKVSTLDLVGKGVFTVFTGVGGEGWLECVSKLSESLGIEINAVQVTVDGELTDHYGTWADSREIEDDGCLIVRPDRFVAYRSKKMVLNPSKELRKAFSQILDLPISF